MVDSIEPWALPSSPLWLKHNDRFFHRQGRDLFLLRLSTPNIISTDLVVSLSFYLIRLTYDSHAVSMLLFSFHNMPHALLTSFISVQCISHAPSLRFHSATAMRSPYVQLRFHFMAVLDARFYLMLLESGIL